MADRGTFGDVKYKTLKKMKGGNVEDYEEMFRDEFALFNSHIPQSLKGQFFEGEPKEILTEYLSKGKTSGKNSYLGFKLKGKKNEYIVVTRVEKCNSSSSYRCPIILKNVVSRRDGLLYCLIRHEYNLRASIFYKKPSDIDRPQNEALYVHEEIDFYDYEMLQSVNFVASQGVIRLSLSFKQMQEIMNMLCKVGKKHQKKLQSKETEDKISLLHMGLRYYTDAGADAGAGAGGADAGAGDRERAHDFKEKLSKILPRNANVSLIAESILLQFLNPRKCVMRFVGRVNPESLKYLIQEQGLCINSINHLEARRWNDLPALKKVIGPELSALKAATQLMYMKCGKVFDKQEEKLRIFVLNLEKVSLYDIFVHATLAESNTVKGNRGMHVVLLFGEASNDKKIYIYYDKHVKAFYLCGSRPGGRYDELIESCIHICQIKSGDHVDDFFARVCVVRCKGAGKLQYIVNGEEYKCLDMELILVDELTYFACNALELIQDNNMIFPFLKNQSLLIQLMILIFTHEVYITKNDFSHLTPNPRAVESKEVLVGRIKNNTALPPLQEEEIQLFAEHIIDVVSSGRFDKNKEVLRQKCQYHDISDTEEKLCDKAQPRGSSAGGSGYCATAEVGQVLDTNTVDGILSLGEGMVGEEEVKCMTPEKLW